MINQNKTFDLNNFEIVFWDFDGVIKESLNIKKNSFINLIDGINNELKKKIANHHNRNGGISRYDKIPIYMEWAGLTTNQKNINLYVSKFSRNIVEAVAESKWVPGVQKALKNKKSFQEFILLTATPQNEIDEILKKLNLTNIFNEVYGYPINKSDTVALVCSRKKIQKNKLLLIGDSQTDYDAAIANDIIFLLRKHDKNYYLHNNKFQSIWNFEELNE